MEMINVVTWDKKTWRVLLLFLSPSYFYCCFIFILWYERSNSGPHTNVASVLLTSNTSCSENNATYKHSIKFIFKYMV